jgi:L-2-hydroxyglutarate oxidase
MVSPAEAREYEPEVAPAAALQVESTAIISYRAVCESIAAELAESAVTMHTGQRVSGITTVRGGVRPEIVVRARSMEVRADALVNCAGLHSDRIARMAGLRPGVQIVPFRGEYYELRPARRALVKGLIYPVPDPAFPFLGVHLTKMIDGSVHAGPNAVLAMSREGYRWQDLSARDIARMLSYPGLWRLARRHYRAGAAEVARSLSAARFAASVARLVPAVTGADMVRAGEGVRAQVVTRSGALADDFLIQTAPHQVHVLNAPSPAATGAFEIARHVADQLLGAMS